MIATQQNNSTELIQVYKKFLANLKFLLDQLKTLRTMLFQVERTLLISKKLSDKLNELYILLLSVDATLMAMMPIPYVGAVAKVVQKVVSKLKKVVKQAKDKVNRIERRIKPHREKIAKFRGYIDKIIKPLVQIQKFITIEEKLLSITYDSTTNLPSSRYKNISLAKLHSTSDILNKILVPPMKLVNKISKLLSSIKDIVKEIEKLCALISKIISPIVKMMGELDRVTGVLKGLGKALSKKLTINLGFFKFSLSIEKILNAAGNIPGLSLLTKMATKILKPILSALGLKIDSIPGLGGGVGNLGKVLDKLNLAEKLKKTMTEDFSALTSQENPQGTFKQVNA